jgi:uncharacterized protein (TIGR02145 family)
MKSSTKVNNIISNGSSKDDGIGFGALLVGRLDGGLPYDYGTYTYFWSSSAGSITVAWRRYLNNNSSGMVRNIRDKYALFSVRCKKL